MIYERKNILKLHTYDSDTKEKVKRNITGFEKINSYSFSHDGKRIVISAVKKGKGQSDIFIYSLNTGGVEQITNIHLIMSEHMIKLYGIKLQT